MSEEMQKGIGIFHTIAQRQIAPMRTRRVVEYFKRWLVGYEHIQVAFGNKVLGVVLALAEELHAIHSHATVLQKVHIGRQILYAFGIPQA